MSNPTVAELVPILQTAIGPALLISGVGLLLLTMTNRLGRVVDRARLLVQQLQEEVPFYRARLLVKPGLTGWAQVNFGYAATVEDTAIKLEYDLYYIKARSLVLDIIIIFRTIGNVLGLRGR